jgi:hypothetical protein
MLSQIEHIRQYVKELKAILDAEESAECGEQKLTELTKKWRACLKKQHDHLGSEEEGFLKEAVKYLSKKKANLMNYRRVPGAPKTNNGHEQRYHRLKYKLRRTIGHVAAKHFLQKHGNSILFVNPDATETEILEIITNAPIKQVRKRIRENRKPRNSLDQIVYDQAKWDAEIAKLKEEFHIKSDLKKGLT